MAQHARGGFLNGSDDSSPIAPASGVSVPPAEALLGAEPTHVFKRDRRSKVWEVSVDGQRYVVKRFDHSLFKQAIVRRLGWHPAQRERRMSRRLADEGFAVVPIAAWGVDRGRSWLATRWAGESAQLMLRPGFVTDLEHRARCVRSVAALWVKLVERGWFFRDFQTANIVFDASDRAMLIDAGSIRRSTRRDHAMRMLAVMDLSAVSDRATRRDRVVFLRHLLELRPDLGDAKTLAAQIAARRARIYNAVP